MGKIYWKQIDMGSIAAGATASGSFTADRNYTIKKIYVKEYTATPVGTRFLNLTLRIEDYTFTLDSVNGSLFDTVPSQAEELNLDFAQGRTFYWSVKNINSSNAIAAYLILHLEEK